MPLWNPFRSKDEERAHEALFAGKGKEFEEAFVKGQKPIVIKQDDKEAESCYAVCPNSGACNDCDLEFH